jgi:MraZ protein
MASFKGKYLTTIDEKRRLKLPKKLRAVMPSLPNDGFVIGPGYDDCIFLFPPDEWGKQEEKLRNLKLDLAEHRFYMRIFVPESEDVTIDRVGRLTLPEELLDRAQIKKEVLIRGVLSHIELWSPEVFKKYREQYKESYEEVADKIFKT